MFWRVVLLFLFIIVMSFLIVGWIFGAPWAPTRKKLVHKMLSMAEVNPGDVLYDLGSGDGRIITMAARQFHAKSVGIEINPLWVLWTKLKIAIFQLNDKMNVVWGNFFNQDLSKANIVTLYLLQKTNDKLRPKLEKELKPGTRIVSHVFTFDGWEPEKVDWESKIYMYRIRNKNQY